VYKDIPTKYLGSYHENHIMIYETKNGIRSRIVELDGNFNPTGKSRILSSSREDFELLSVKKVDQTIVALYRTFSESKCDHYIASIDLENFQTTSSTHISSSNYPRGHYDFINGIYPNWSNDHELSYLYVADVNETRITLNAIHLDQHYNFLSNASYNFSLDLGFIPGYQYRLLRSWNKPIGVEEKFYDLKLDFGEKKLNIMKYEDGTDGQLLEIFLPIDKSELIDAYWWKKGNIISVLSGYGKNDPGGKLKGVCLCTLSVTTMDKNCTKFDLPTSLINSFSEELEWNATYAKKMKSQRFIDTQKFHAHYENSDGFNFLVTSEHTVPRNLLVLGIEEDLKVSWIKAIKGSNRKTIFKDEYHSFNDFYYSIFPHNSSTIFFYNGNLEEDQGIEKYKRAFTISPNETIMLLAVDEEGATQKRVIIDYSGKAEDLYWENSTFRMDSDQYLLLRVDKKDLGEQSFIKVTVQ